MSEQLTLNYINLTPYLISLVLGLIAGSLLEFAYKSNEQKRLVPPKFINIQMYGLVAVFLFMLSQLNWPWPVEVLAIVAITTGLELITGLMNLKINQARAWDYSGEVWNYRGLICLKFSVYWLLLGAVYYYLILPRIFN